MSELKHTPGPWWVELARRSHGLWVDAAERGICQMTGRVNAEREANANLIAAAPDLLAALEEIAQAQTIDYMVTVAKEAIAKAKGE